MALTGDRNGPCVWRTETPAGRLSVSLSQDEDVIGVGIYPVAERGKVLVTVCAENDNLAELVRSIVYDADDRVRRDACAMLADRLDQWFGVVTPACILDALRKVGAG